MGAVVEGSPLAREGGYQLSGITEVAEHLPIGTIIDRGWPDYAYPAPLEGRNMRDYGVQDAASTQGHVVVRVAPGGATYRVLVLDDSDESLRVKAVFGPYDSN